MNCNDIVQISCMDSHDRWHFIRRNGSMSVSSDLLSMQDCDQSTVGFPMIEYHLPCCQIVQVVSSASKRGQFPYAYLKSKLSTLPEELGGGQNKYKEESQQGSVIGSQVCDGIDPGISLMNFVLASPRRDPSCQVLPQASGLKCWQ